MATSEAMSERWSGWISFAGLMIIIIGGLDFFEGLIAVIRGQYYAITPSQIVVVDLTTWGWVMMIWGVILVLAGFGILSGASWARWFSIVVLSLNVIAQLGFVGSAQYPLWALTVLTLTIVVLYALIVRWNDAMRAA
jgi:hypothetical protein